jgi:hypothetical protein
MLLYTALLYSVKRESRVFCLLLCGQLLYSFFCQRSQRTPTLLRQAAPPQRWGSKNVKMYKDSDTQCS